MKKPIWLKKSFPNKPWKYPMKTEYGVILVYNFDIDIFSEIGSLDVQEAINWIDQECRILVVPTEKKEGSQ